MESVGNAPTSACLQGKCIACLPRPQDGKSPWCCPRQAEFWRLGRTGWCATCWKLACRALARCLFGKKSVFAMRFDATAFVLAPLWAKAGAVAGNRTRTCSLARNHSAVKSQPRKLKGPEVSLHFRPTPFQQRTNTSCYLAIPTRGFTAAVSVFRGTPPPKPLKCKVGSNHFGARSGGLWTHHTG